MVSYTKLTHIQQYNAEILKIVEYWKGVSSDDFAVVYQPATQNLQIPGEEYISKFDCFHPNALAGMVW